MKYSNKFHKFSILLSTVFKIGYLPFIPGTFGSLAGVVIYILFRGDVFLIGVFVILVTILSFLTLRNIEEVFNRKDPGEVVIDEVIGMLISIMALPYDVKTVILGFVIFRIFDVLKPFPIRKSQILPNIYGIVIDDVIAGIYTNLVLRIIFSLN